MVLGPVLKGRSIQLEPVGHEDLPLWSTWFADGEITRYLMARFVPSDQEQRLRYDRLAKDESAVWWRIVVRGQTVGSTLLRDIDWQNRHAESALLIGLRSAWGHGYASEAVRLRTAYAFGELNLERLESDSYVENIAMHRALEKSGYRAFGRRRRYVFRDGGWHDLVMFELLRHEWEVAKNGDAPSRTGGGIETQ